MAYITNELIFILLPSLQLSPVQHSISHSSKVPNCVLIPPRIAAQAIFFICKNHHRIKLIHAVAGKLT